MRVRHDGKVEGLVNARQGLPAATLDLAERRAPADAPLRSRFGNFVPDAEGRGLQACAGQHLRDGPLSGPLDEGEILPRI